MYWAQCRGTVSWVCWNIYASPAHVSSMQQALAGMWQQTGWQCWITHCSHRPTQAVSVLSTNMKKCFCLHGISTFPKTHLSKCSSFSGALTQTSKTLAHFLETAAFQFPGFQPTWKTRALSRDIGLVVPISQSESLCLARFLASRGLRLVALVMMMTAKPGILFSQILQWYCWFFSWDAKSAPILKVQNFQKFWGYRRCTSVQLCFLTSEENKNILYYLPDTKFLKNKLQF